MCIRDRRKTHEEIYEAEDEGAPERGEDFQAMVTQLAINCFHSGIPEEETVKRTIFHYYLRRQEVLIRQLVKNVYEEQKGFGKKSSLGKEQDLSLQTEEFKMCIRDSNHAAPSHLPCG